MFTDIHSHIIPGVDDGSTSIEDTKEMLDIAYKEGIRKMVATPHHHPRRGMPELDELYEKYEIVKNIALEIDPEFKIYLGTEIYYTSDILDKLKNKEILSINNTKVVLLEFSSLEQFPVIQQAINEIQSLGYDIILAHIERYKCLRENWDLTNYIADMGVYIQVNSSTILDRHNNESMKYVRKLLENKMVYLVGTDSHDTNKRAPLMKKASEFVKKKYGKNFMNRIFYGNANSIIEGIEEYDIWKSVIE